MRNARLTLHFYTKKKSQSFIPEQKISFKSIANQTKLNFDSVVPKTKDLSVRAHRLHITPAATELDPFW